MNTMMISRRRFALKFLSCSVVAGLGRTPELLAGIGPLNNRLSLSIHQLLERYPQDKVDDTINYLNTWDEQNSYYLKSQSFLEKHVFPLTIPSEKKVILGSYRHVSLNMFCKNYGKKDCIGIDIFNYQDHPQSLIKDVRQLGANELGKLAIGWNNLSVWSGSPRSKLSGFNFIKSSLLKGGILIENPIQYIPQDLCLKDFQLLYQNDFGSIWRKTS